MGAEPTLAEIMRRAIDSRMLDVHVALPGRVESYDPSKQTCEVLPMVRRAIADTEGNTQHEDLPKLPNVPVLFPRSAAFSATWPLAKGDFVLVVFCSSAIGQWRETGEVSNPVDLRRHDLSHAIAIPGIAPKGSTIPTASDAALLEVSGTATHVQVGAGSAEFVSRDDKVQARLGELFDAITNAVPKPGGLDGGAQFKTQLLAALTSAGWSSTGTSPTTAATKLKSE